MNKEIDFDKLVEWLKERRDTYKELMETAPTKELYRRDCGCMEAYINVLFQLVSGSFAKNS